MPPRRTAFACGTQQRQQATQQSKEARITFESRIKTAPLSCSPRKYSERSAAALEHPEAKSIDVANRVRRINGGGMALCRQLACQCDEHKNDRSWRASRKWRFPPLHVIGKAFFKRGLNGLQYVSSPEVRSLNGRNPHTPSPPSQGRYHGRVRPERR